MVWAEITLLNVENPFADFCPSCCKSCDHDGWTSVNTGIDEEDEIIIAFDRLEPCFQCCPCGPPPRKRERSKTEMDEGIIIAKDNPMFQPSSFHQHYPQPYAGPTQPQMQQAPYPYPQQNNGQGYYTLNGNGAQQPPPYPYPTAAPPPTSPVASREQGARCVYYRDGKVELQCKLPASPGSVWCSSHTCPQCRRALKSSRAPTCDVCSASSPHAARVHKTIESI